MCRFVGYLGKNPVLIGDILEKPNNSLINQSKEAREGKRGLNADGFGIGWYNHAVDGLPGIYKSTQPAWNDFNLRHMTDKITSTCFLGHVRSSTVGDVNWYNCHPFSYGPFLFVHNGTIRAFDQIKRSLLNQLSDPFFNIVHGQTDSEHFFALLMMLIEALPKPHAWGAVAGAMREAIYQVNQLQDPKGGVSRINTVLTDGQRLLITRYVTHPEQEVALSLYTHLMREFAGMPSAVVVASEPLSDYAKEWTEVPVNTMLLIDAQFNFTQVAL